MAQLSCSWIRQEDIAMEAAASAFDRMESTATWSVVGWLRGYRVTFCLALGASWSVVVDTPHVGLAMEIVSHNQASGGVSDVQFGDEVFDARYFVDAAPLDVARATLVLELRDRILALAPKRLLMVPGTVRLEKRYKWYFAETADIREAIDLAVTCAEAATATTKEWEVVLVRNVRQADDPYRGNVDVTSMDRAVAMRDSAVSSVASRARRRRRKISPAAIALLTYVIFLVFAVVLTAVSAL